MDYQKGESRKKCHLQLYQKEKKLGISLTKEMKNLATENYDIEEKV